MTDEDPCPARCRTDPAGRVVRPGDRVRVRGVRGVGVAAEARRLKCGACGRPELVADFNGERLTGRLALVRKR